MVELVDELVKATRLSEPVPRRAGPPRRGGCYCRRGGSGAGAVTDPAHRGRAGSAGAGGGLGRGGPGRGVHGGEHRPPRMPRCCSGTRPTLGYAGAWTACRCWCSPIPSAPTGTRGGHHPGRPGSADTALVTRLVVVDAVLLARRRPTPCGCPGPTAVRGSTCSADSGVWGGRVGWEPMPPGVHAAAARPAGPELMTETSMTRPHLATAPSPDSPPASRDYDGTSTQTTHRRSPSAGPSRR